MTKQIGWIILKFSEAGNTKMQAAKKGEQTREMILERAAQLFSLKGYFGSSMADLAQETGLGKSGFYNHFQSKDDLALQAFDYAAAEMSRRFQQALEGKTNSIERLQSLLGVFQGIADHPFLAGGCHLLNTAIESDDAHPALRERAIKSADKWQAMLQTIVRKGVERGEIRPEISPEDFATVFISTVEGAEMLNKLYGDAVHMRRAIAFLGQYIETQLKPTS